MYWRLPGRRIEGHPTVGPDAQVARAANCGWFTSTTWPGRVLSAAPGAAHDYLCLHGQVLDEACPDCVVDYRLVRTSDR